MGVFKEIFVDFARETSIHGPNFLMHKSFFGQKRIIWALALLGIFTYCTYFQKSTIECKFDRITYCKVAISNTSRLETHANCFLISALASNNGSNEKIEGTLLYVLIRGLYFFYLTLDPLSRYISKII